MKSVTVVVPVFNEATVIRQNVAEILCHCQSIAGISLDLLLVDDGSSDDTVAQVQVLCAENDAVRLLCLCRNFGKEAAILAGLRAAQHSDAVIVMDSDLQHPPVVIPKMIHLWHEQGYVVVDACKQSRGQESWLKRLSARGYYALFGLLTGLNIKQQSDFKLLDQQVVVQYCQLPERQRFFRGLIHWMQFDTAQIYFDVPYDPNNDSSWSRWRLVQYAVSSITSFTSYPLHAVTIFGVITALLGLVVGGIALHDKWVGQAVDGFTTVILLLLLIGSILMFSLGLIGLYLAKIYTEIKKRPAYMVDKINSRLRK